MFMRLYANLVNVDGEHYRGIDGALASVCTFMLTGKHSWERFGSYINFYALTDKVFSIFENLSRDFNLF